MEDSVESGADKDGMSAAGEIPAAGEAPASPAAKVPTGSPTAAGAPAAVPLAMTVNGEGLPLSVLTRYVDAVRATIGSQTDAAWEAYLRDQGHTVDTYWNHLLEHYGVEMAVTQRCDELGVEVTEAEMAARIAQIKAALGVTSPQTEFLWDAYLKRGGYTEQSLRVNLSYQMRLGKLFEREVATAPGATPDSEALGRYVRGLFERAEVVVHVAHQYDAPGQRHGNVPAVVAGANLPSSRDADPSSAAGTSGASTAARSSSPSTSPDAE